MRSWAANDSSLSLLVKSSSFLGTSNKIEAEGLKQRSRVPMWSTSIASGCTRSKQRHQRCTVGGLHSWANNLLLLMGEGSHPHMLCSSSEPSFLGGSAKADRIFQSWLRSCYHPSHVGTMHLQMTSYHLLGEVIGCLGKPESQGVAAPLEEHERHQQSYGAFKNLECRVWLSLILRTHNRQ